MRNEKSPCFSLRLTPALFPLLADYLECFIHRQLSGFLTSTNACCSWQCNGNGTDYFDADSVVLFGSSFGAKTVFHAAVDDTRVEALVGRAPVTYNRTFDEMQAIVDETGFFEYDTGHTVDHRFFDDFAQYSFETVIESLEIPVALFHGGADESVSLTDSLDATAAFETDVLLQVFRDEGHLFSETAEEQMQRQLFDWLALS